MLYNTLYMNRVFEIFRGRLFKDMLKYGLVSIIALVVDFCSLLVLNSVFHVHYLTSATIAFLLGLTANYILSNNRVFTGPKISNKTLNFIAFGTIGIIGLASTNFILWMCYEKIGLGLVLAKIISVVIVFFWNFLARRQFLYQGHKITKETISNDY